MGSSVDDFFAQLQKKAENGKAKFATWYGELYFELHRGTYTTQANNKRNNRMAEILLRDIELLTTLASIDDHSFKYPKEELDEMASRAETFWASIWLTSGTSGKLSYFVNFMTVFLGALLN